MGEDGQCRVDHMLNGASAHVGMHSRVKIKIDRLEFAECGPHGEPFIQSKNAFPIRFLCCSVEINSINSDV